MQRQCPVPLDLPPPLGACLKKTQHLPCAHCKLPAPESPLRAPSCSLEPGQIRRPGALPSAARPALLTPPAAPLPSRLRLPPRQAAPRPRLRSQPGRPRSARGRAARSTKSSAAGRGARCAWAPHQSRRRRLLPAAQAPARSRPVTGCASLCRRRHFPAAAALPPAVRFLHSPGPGTASPCAAGPTQKARRPGPSTRPNRPAPRRERRQALRIPPRPGHALSESSAHERAEAIG